MPYKYILRWKRAEKETLRVEAWPRTKYLALPKETVRPSFVIGRVSGPRTLMLYGAAKEAIEEYGYKQRGGTIAVHFPPENMKAIGDAYRIGLAAAVLDKASGEDEAEAALQYVLRTTKEEVWFWTSKILRVIDSGIQTDRVIQALCLISGAQLTTSSSH